MDNHADHEDELRQRAEASVGGRWMEGKECPHTAELFLSAASTEVPEGLQDHLAKCPVCMRTFSMARETIDDLDMDEDAQFEPANTSDRPSNRDFFPDLAQFRVPVIRSFSSGRVRCLAGESVLAIFLEPCEPGSSWGKTCLIDVGDRHVEVHPDIVSSDSLVEWRRGTQISVRIQGGSETDELSFDWEGWGKDICFIAVAYYRGSVEQCDAVLHELQPVCAFTPVGPVPIALDDLRGDGVRADRAFDRFWQCVEVQLRRKLASWKAIGSVAPIHLDQALEQAAVLAYRERKSIPREPAMWLLRLAATLLLEILENVKILENQPPTVVAKPAASAAAQGQSGKLPAGAAVQIEKNQALSSLLSEPWNPDGLLIGVLATG